MLSKDATDLSPRSLGAAAKGLIQPSRQSESPLCCLKPPPTTTAEKHNKHHWNMGRKLFAPLHFYSKLYRKVLVLIQIICEKSFRPSFRRSLAGPCGAYQATIQYIHHWISITRMNRISHFSDESSLKLLQLMKQSSALFSTPSQVDRGTSNILFSSMLCENHKHVVSFCNDAFRYN